MKLKIEGSSIEIYSESEQDSILLGRLSAKAGRDTPKKHYNTNQIFLELPVDIALEILCK